jgi:Resolvase, N terminal domain
MCFFMSFNVDRTTFEENGDMAIVGYARVSSTGQSLVAQTDKLAACERVFTEKRSGVDAGRPELKRCLDYVRIAEKGVAFKVIDDPTIDTTSRTGNLFIGFPPWCERSPRRNHYDCATTAKLKLLEIK